MAHGHDIRGDRFHIELFVFPDGAEVELMVFDGRGDDARATAFTGCGRAPEPQAPPAPVDGVPAAPASLVGGVEARACPSCGCKHVYPLDWRRESDTTWSLLLRCPNCEVQRSVLMDRPGVEALNRELYRAHQAVTEQARRLARRNFEEAAERFVEALDKGLIEPMDF